LKYNQITYQQQQDIFRLITDSLYNQKEITKRQEKQINSLKADLNTLEEVFGTLLTTVEKTFINSGKDNVEINKIKANLINVLDSIRATEKLISGQTVNKEKLDSLLSLKENYIKQYNGILSRENVLLKSNNEFLKQENWQLKNENKKKKQLYDKLFKNYNLVLDSNKVLKAKISSLVNNNNQQDITSLQTQLANILKDNRIKEDTIKQMEIRISKTESEKIQLQDSVKNLTLDIKKVKDELDREKANDKQAFGVECYFTYKEGKNNETKVPLSSNNGIPKLYYNWFFGIRDVGGTVFVSPHKHLCVSFKIDLSKFEKDELKEVIIEVYIKGNPAPFDFKPEISIKKDKKEYSYCFEQIDFIPNTYYSVKIINKKNKSILNERGNEFRFFKREN
jgi:hypothetical protein